MLWGRDAASFSLTHTSAQQPLPSPSPLILLFFQTQQSASSLHPPHPQPRGSFPLRSLEQFLCLAVADGTTNSPVS